MASYEIGWTIDQLIYLEALLRNEQNLKALEAVNGRLRTMEGTDLNSLMNEITDGEQTALLLKELDRRGIRMPADFPPVLTDKQETLLLLDICRRAALKSLLVESPDKDKQG
jgi:hypothetical protein